ncbi:HPr family phosphocarrier protein [Caldanaerobacter subterraneus KAk]|uniref:HPr family phosphocarrier protein n=1 Tax=Caldanaerobacter subterraneus TaxID=911092 RepID=UPI0032C1DB13
MKEIKVKLSTIESVKRFVEKTSKYPFEIDVVSGRYVIDAKSIMGLFSLNLENVLTVVAHTDNEEEMKKLEEDLKEFTAQN